MYIWSMKRIIPGDFFEIVSRAGYRLSPNGFFHSKKERSHDLVPDERGKSRRKEAQTTRDILSKQLLVLAAMAVCIGAGAQDRLAMLVGTYTEGGSSKGVYLYSFDQETAREELLDTAWAGNPSFVAFSADGRFAYSVSEYADGRAGAVSYRLGPGTVDRMNGQPLGEGCGDPCNLLITGGHLLTANYTGGSLSFLPVAPDGTLLPSGRTFTPSKPSHMHCALLSPDGEYIFATDLGGDRIFRQSARLPETAEAAAVYAGKKGLGPRHMVFSPDGRFAYLINELGDALTVFRYRGGTLKKIQQLEAYSGKGHGSADIHLTPDGRFLYTSHRLEGDGIALFQVDRKTGKVKKAGFQPTGKHPRNFTVTPNGKYLLCACRDSGCIEIYAIDPADGRLADTGRRIELPKPVCIALQRPGAT